MLLKGHNARLVKTLSYRYAKDDGKCKKRNNGKRIDGRWCDTYWLRNIYFAYQGRVYQAVMYYDTAPYDWSE